MNNFSAIGRIGKDATVRHTAGGDSVAGWSLAVDSGYGDKKQTLWIDCSLWGKRAEKVAEHITKGSQLGVSGELGTREYEGKTHLTLKVADVTFVGGKPQGEAKAPATRERRVQQELAAADAVGLADDDIPF